MMKDYTIQEGQFLYPGENWLDTSMNVIRNPMTQSSMIVSRGQIAQGRHVEQELDHQWSLLEPLVEQLKSEPRQPVILSQHPDILAFENLSQFVRAGNTHHQRQLAVGLPDGKSLLIFTYSAMQPFTEEEDLYWQHFKDTLKLTQ